jgi:hypothetical protein
LPYGFRTYGSAVLTKEEGIVLAPAIEDKPGAVFIDEPIKRNTWSVIAGVQSKCPIKIHIFDMYPDVEEGLDQDNDGFEGFAEDGYFIKLQPLDGSTMISLHQLKGNDDVVY